MANMSYCRMENTANDLQDVYNEMEEQSLTDLFEDFKRSSQSEMRSMKRILQLAKLITEMAEEENIEEYL